MSSGRSLGIRGHPDGEPDLWKWSGHVERLCNARRTFLRSMTVPDAVNEGVC